MDQEQRDDIYRRLRHEATVLIDLSQMVMGGESSETWRDVLGETTANLAAVWKEFPRASPQPENNPDFY